MMTRKDMVAKLEQAQMLMGQVYRFASENNIHDLERSLSCADTCVNEAIEYIKEDKTELLYNDVLAQITTDIFNQDSTAIVEMIKRLSPDVLQSYLTEE